MFELDLRSRLPLYEQLVEKFKQLIISEILKPNEQLPSVRTISMELTMNPNTIQKAYKELEIQGYIHSIKGKGSFVTPSSKVADSEKLKKIENELTKILSEAMYMGMTKEYILKIISQIQANKKEE